MKILQVCNVGRIAGGTAACAWSIARAFPDAEHHIAFLSPVADETRTEFSQATLHQCDRVTNAFVNDLKADCVILHNTASHRCERITSAWTMQYVHSRGPRAPADSTVYCSRWLARQCGAEEGDVLLQCVPRPPGLERTSPARGLVVGRICTPTSAKWPPQLVEFYRDLSADHPGVRWEFVGCPPDLRPRIEKACQGRASFHGAGWHARSHLARWHVLLYHNPKLTESFGRTVAEAMRGGCVPVVDACGGFCEQVTGSTGFLCSSPAEFVRALTVLRGSEHWLEVSRQARIHADQAFSMTAFRQRLLQMWRSAAITH